MNPRLALALLLVATLAPAASASGPAGSVALPGADRSAPQSTLEPTGSAAAKANPDPTRFDKEIAAFEDEDRVSPPAPGGTLFVGSSSIRYWDVTKAFPGLRAVKRGYGGSHVSDTLHFADRIIFRYAPAEVVFYAGDADVAAGKTAEQIAADTLTLVDLVHTRLPNTAIVVIGTKPSPAHWSHMATIRAANGLVRQRVAGDAKVTFVDVERALLGPDGKPRPDFYVENGLNLNESGYAAWTEATRAAIERARPRP
ncbi:MAG: GDSL-type esterase/lipase family protein [Vicinamibacterales bacterium]